MKERWVALLRKPLERVVQHNADEDYKKRDEATLAFMSLLRKSVARPKGGTNRRGIRALNLLLTKLQQQEQAEGKIAGEDIDVRAPGSYSSIIGDARHLDSDMDQDEEEEPQGPDVASERRGLDRDEREARRKIARASQLVRDGYSGKGA